MCDLQRTVQYVGGASQYSLRLRRHAVTVFPRSAIAGLYADFLKLLRYAMMIGL
jgi:hypothetical protein